MICFSLFPSCLLVNCFYKNSSCRQSLWTLPAPNYSLLILPKRKFDFFHNFLTSLYGLFVDYYFLPRKEEDLKMSSSSYNTSVVPSSPSTQPFFITGSGAGDNAFDRKDTFMSMIQQPNSSAPQPKKRRNQPGNPSKYLLLTFIYTSLEF